jgi:hypothetical protein
MWKARAKPVDKLRAKKNLAPRRAVLAGRGDCARVFAIRFA